MMRSRFSGSSVPTKTMVVAAGAGGSDPGNGTTTAQLHASKFFDSSSPDSWFPDNAKHVNKDTIVKIEIDAATRKIGRAGTSTEDLTLLYQEGPINGQRGPPSTRTSTYKNVPLPEQATEKTQDPDSDARFLKDAEEIAKLPRSLIMLGAVRNAKVHKTKEKDPKTNQYVDVVRTVYEIHIAGTNTIEHVSISSTYSDKAQIGIVRFTNTLNYANLFGAPVIVLRTREQTYKEGTEYGRSFQQLTGHNSYYTYINGSMALAIDTKHPAGLKCSEGAISNFNLTNSEVDNWVFSNLQAAAHLFHPDVQPANTVSYMDAFATNASPEKSIMFSTENGGPVVACVPGIVCHTQVKPDKSVLTATVKLPRFKRREQHLEDFESAVVDLGTMGIFRIQKNHAAEMPFIQVGTHVAIHWTRITNRGPFVRHAAEDADLACVQFLNAVHNHTPPLLQVRKDTGRPVELCGTVSYPTVFTKFADMQNFGRIPGSVVPSVAHPFMDPMGSTSASRTPEQNMVIELGRQYQAEVPPQQRCHLLHERAPYMLTPQLERNYSQCISAKEADPNFQPRIPGLDDDWFGAPITHNEEEEEQNNLAKMHTAELLPVEEQPQHEQQHPPQHHAQQQEENANTTEASAGATGYPFGGLAGHHNITFLNEEEGFKAFFDATTGSTRTFTASETSEAQEKMSVSAIVAANAVPLDRREATPAQQNPAEVLPPTKPEASNAEKRDTPHAVDSEGEETLFAEAKKPLLPQDPVATNEDNDDALPSKAPRLDNATANAPSAKHSTE